MTSTVVVEVALFAAARALAKSDTLSVQVPDDATAGEVLRQIGLQFEPLKTLVPTCRLAVNLQYVSDDHLVPREASLALIPPVSGG